MKGRINKYLYDALEASKAILYFVHDKDLTDYSEDELLQSAVERKFEIIGESLNRIRQSDEKFLSDSFTDAYKIIGFRNILIHGYDIIDNELVWNAIEKHLPLLIKEVSIIIGK